MLTSKSLQFKKEYVDMTIKRNPKTEHYRNLENFYESMVELI